MRLHLFTHLGSASLTLGCLALLAPGCAGGQTGDLSGQHPGGTETGDAGGCEEHKQKLAGLDTMTDSGTAEEVLAYAERAFDAPLTWKAPQEGQTWTLGPEVGEGVIHVDVARGAHAYALTYTAKPSSSGLDVGSICPPPQLGVDAHLSVTTDGGALAESFDTLLRASMPGVATFSVPLDLDKLTGSLSVVSSIPQAKFVQTSLDGTLMPEGTTGTISGIAQVDSGSGASGATSAFGAVIAVWPSGEACQAYANKGGGLGLAVDQPALGVTGSDSLASVATPTPVAVAWLDGVETTLTLGIESTGDGCFRPIGPILDGPEMVYPVTLTLKSADGRVDGQYAGQVVVTGSGSERRVTASANLELGVDELAKSGFKSISVPDGSDGVALQVDSKVIAGVFSGSVHLFAVSNPPCLTNPEPPMSTPDGGMSSPGCAGQSRTQLETASWGG